MDSGESPLLRVREVAALLGVSRSRVYDLIGKGAIPAIRIDGALRVPRSAWDEWLGAKTAQALAATRAGLRPR